MKMGFKYNRYNASTTVFMAYLWYLQRLFHLWSLILVLVLIWNIKPLKRFLVMQILEFCKFKTGNHIITKYFQV
jgi:hypothetical protein